MSTFNYLKSRATADKLITRFGQAAVIQRETASGTEYDPTLTPADYDVMVVLVDYTDREINGTSILAGDKRALVKAGGLSIEILTSDKFVLDSVVHTIVQVKPLSPGGTVVMYELQVRR